LQSAALAKTSPLVGCSANTPKPREGQTRGGKPRQAFKSQEPKWQEYLSEQLHSEVLFAHRVLLLHDHGREKEKLDAIADIHLVLGDADIFQDLIGPTNDSTENRQDQ
jgi:hypothetical protein